MKTYDLALGNAGIVICLLQSDCVAKVLPSFDALYVPAVLRLKLGLYCCVDKDTLALFIGFGFLVGEPFGDGELPKLLEDRQV